MGKGRILRLLRWVLPILATILAVAALSAPVAARASARLAQTSAAVMREGSTFVCLSLSVKSEPLKFRARKGVIGVLVLDVDHDGYTDVVTLRRNSRVHVWLNNGHGGFVRRSRNDSRASSGNRFRSGDTQQTGAYCWPPSNDEAIGLVHSSPASGEGLLLFGRNRIELNSRFLTDPFLNSRATRGPPEFLA
jgi:hypothetical protein